jgi:hypothetical protein
VARNSGIRSQGRGHSNERTEEKSAQRGGGGGVCGRKEEEEECMEETQVIEITSTPGAMCVRAVRVCACARTEHCPSLRPSPRVRHTCAYMHKYIRIYIHAYVFQS